jgi:hypothetical protein
MIPDHPHFSWVHFGMLQYRPAVHCPHVGPTGPLRFAFFLGLLTDYHVTGGYMYVCFCHRLAMLTPISSSFSPRPQVQRAQREHPLFAWPVCDFLNVMQYYAATLNNPFALPFVAGA